MTATATADRAAVRLSESVRVTLTVDGPAPLRVEAAGVPDAPSAEVWRIRPDGPPATTDLPNGRQRWSRAFRADPYQPGDPLRLGFAPARVSAGADARPADVPVPAVHVRVTTEVTDPSAATIRPITGVEDVPPPPAPPTTPAWPWAVGGGALALAVAGWWFRRRRPSAPPSPDQRARLALDAASAALARGVPPAEVAGLVAAAVRGFVSARFALSAEHLTTAELLAAGAWPPAAGDELRAVLEACDRAKFGGAADDPGDLLRRAAALLPALTAVPETPS